ncbi:hypothetical protein V2J09_007454 [Rumex salicifolius]
MSSSLFYFEEETYGQSRQIPEPHFLAACCMCRKPLGVDRDIFMYRGIYAFCSEECRQEQIQIDSRPPWRPKKTGWDLSASFRALKKAIPAAARSWRPSSGTAAVTTA